MTNFTSLYKYNYCIVHIKLKANAFSWEGVQSSCEASSSPRDLGQGVLICKLMELGQDICRGPPTSP